MEAALSQALTIYLAVNIALTFSLALPAAGMLNHLIPGVADFERAILLWMAATLACLLMTLPVIPVVRQRRRQKSDESKPGS